jgi:hypothetical protein
MMHTRHFPVEMIALQSWELPRLRHRRPARSMRVEHSPCPMGTHMHTHFAKYRCVYDGAGCARCAGFRFGAHKSHMAESTVSLVRHRLTWRRCNLAVILRCWVSISDSTRLIHLGQISTLQVRACVCEASALSVVGHSPPLRAHVLACPWRRA